MKFIESMRQAAIKALREDNPDLTDAEADEFGAALEQAVEDQDPPKIAMIGPSGVGKTSTINALFSKGLPISHTEACTAEEAELHVSVAEHYGTNGSVIIYDMPGLGEDEEADVRHVETYNRVLPRVDVALIVLSAPERGHLSAMQQLMRQQLSQIAPELTANLVVGLNKADLIHPGERSWHPLANTPSPEQVGNLVLRERDVRQKVVNALPEWSGPIISYSADKRFNLEPLLEGLINAASNSRGFLLSRRSDVADMRELIDPRLLAAVDELRKHRRGES